MISQYPVFIPKLLPRDEYFVSGRRSCKGCGKAITIRMICKMMGREAHTAKDVHLSSLLSSYRATGEGLNWDELLSGELTTSFIKQFLTDTAAPSEKGPRRPATKAVVGIDRRVFLKDPLALSDLLGAPREVVYICYDSEMYMDALIKKTLPSFNGHEGEHPIEKEELRHFIRNKAIPSQVWECNISYSATACPSYPLDLMEKIKKGLRISGMAFISVLTPCPTGWLFKPEITAYLGVLAVSTGFYPLFEAEAGKVTLTQRTTQLRPLADYFKAQQRYIPFPAALITLMQEVVKEEYQKLETS